MITKALNLLELLEANINPTIPTFDELYKYVTPGVRRWAAYGDRASLPLLAKILNKKLEEFQAEFANKHYPEIKFSAEAKRQLGSITTDGRNRITIYLPSYERNLKDYRKIAFGSDDEYEYRSPEAQDAWKESFFYDLVKGFHHTLMHELVHDDQFLRMKPFPPTRRMSQKRRRDHQTDGDFKLKASSDVEPMAYAISDANAIVNFEKFNTLSNRKDKLKFANKMVTLRGSRLRAKKVWGSDSRAWHRYLRDTMRYIEQELDKQGIE